MDLKIEHHLKIQRNFLSGFLLQVHKWLLVKLTISLLLIHILIDVDVIFNTILLYQFQIVLADEVFCQGYS